MEAWAQQAPLLYPAQRRATATDEGSSGSIPREMEEEVKCQVEQALRDQHRGGMSELQDENRRLKEQLQSGMRAVPEGVQAIPYLSVIGLLQPAVLPCLRVVGLMLPAVSQCLSVIGFMLPAVIPCLRDRAYAASSHPVLECVRFMQAVKPHLSVIGLIHCRT